MSDIALKAHVEQPELKRRYKLINFSQSQLYGLFFGHIGKFSMIALYFISLLTLMTNVISIL